MSTAFKPSTRQRVIATALSRNAQLLGRASTLRRLDRQAGDHFDEPRIGHLIAHVAARQSELGRAIAEEFRAGRFGATSILLRSALETTAWIAWPLAGKTDAEQRQRLIRLLLQGYRDLRNKG